MFNDVTFPDEDEYAEGFFFLWLIEGKEENTLMVIGTKENRIRLKNG